MATTAPAVKGTTRLLPLGDIDQVAPRIYVRLVFTFKLQDNYVPTDAHNHLAARFHHALRRWPFLAGQLRPVTAVDQDPGPVSRGVGVLELVYTTGDDESAMNPHLRPDIFLYDLSEKALIGGEAVPYDALAARGMPPSAMDKDVFSLSPQHPRPGASCPPVTLKATELAGGGGLFVCFAFHHAIFDGSFMRRFLHYFAGDGDAAAPGAGFEDELCRAPCLREMAGHPAVGPDEFPEYDFAPAGPEGAAGERPGETTCRIFQFEHSTLSDLRERILRSERAAAAAAAPHSFVTIVDVLCALVQVHVCRARYKAGLRGGACLRLDPDETAAFSTAGDFRARISAPPLTGAGAGDRRRPAPWGNMWAPVMVSDSGASVRRLIGAAGGEMAVTLCNDDDAGIEETVARQARRIRCAIAAAAADEAYMPKRIALARQMVAAAQQSSSSPPGPAASGGGGEPHAELAAAHSRALRPGRAGLGCSVWAHMGADADFGIPGAAAAAGGGRADFVRKTWSATDGSMNVLQRRGGTKGAEAPWEVLLALRKEDMEILCEKGELGRWASRWVE